MRLFKCIIMVFGICFISDMNAQTDNITRKRSETQNVQSVQSGHASQNIPASKGTANKKITASYSNGVLTVNDVHYVFVKVQSGSFTMGATPEMQDPDDDEKPAHKVTLSYDYYIGKTEVTQALWKAVMGNNPSVFIGNNLPVENVSWDDCQKFILKLNSLTGQNFRLPTEAEWEFAARGGNYSSHYYSGSNKLLLRDVAWYDGNSGSKTHAVATKQPNELGIYDMIGNVCEWCSDWYGKYDSSSQTNPTGPNSGFYRVSRGGSFYYLAKFCRASVRRYSDPECGTEFLGLRLVLVP